MIPDQLLSLLKIFILNIFSAMPDLIYIYI